VPANLTDEQRWCALTLLVPKAQHGDDDARAKLAEPRASFPALYEALTARELWPSTEPGTFDKPLVAPPDVP